MRCGPAVRGASVNGTVFGRLPDGKCHVALPDNMQVVLGALTGATQRVAWAPWQHGPCYRPRRRRLPTFSHDGCRS
ncbi:hypothetical protein TKWG_01950 [Advenella kashmirensis WT001]|uniref:Uncharacterized protein n=1 Tax=Advenella kashmirensis (strain DSM 17095 / LMG 22695 / WT001) TaxID=1036672 RepID=I3U7Q2_ADVKW|nr:hypothetical protein TKWG_01950 [Advenella kashmirensis WT001]